MACASTGHARMIRLPYPLSHVTRPSLTISNPVPIVTRDRLATPIYEKCYKCMSICNLCSACRFNAVFYIDYSLLHVQRCGPCRNPEPAGRGAQRAPRLNVCFGGEVGSQANYSLMVKMETPSDNIGSVQDQCRAAQGLALAK